MLKIIKGVLYQASRNLIVFLAIFLGVLGPLGMMVVNDEFSGDDINAGTLMLSYSSEFPILMVVIIIIAGALVAGADFADKTINYEMLNGHKKFDVYFGRLIATYGYVLCVYWLAFIFQVVLFNILYEWGDNVTLTGMLCCYFVAMFPLLRFTTSVVVMTFLFQNPYISALINYVLVGSISMALMFFQAATKIEVGFLSSMTSIMSVLGEHNGHLGFVNGEDVMIYDTSFTGLELAQHIGYSVAFCAVFIAIGYAVFKKLDLK